MCEHHLSITRRNLGLVGASVLGTLILPRISRASEVEALAFSCIDFRLVDAALKFFDTDIGAKDYDLLALAGASLGAVSPKFPSSNAAFWDHVEIAKTLHHIKKIIVLDHRDCGAYKVAFGKDFASERNAETAQHKAMMTSLRFMLGKKHPDLTAEFYLMALDGSAERVI